MTIAIKKLNKYDRKYYFHGSPIKGLDELEPRYAPNLAYDDPFTKDKAVYAADNYQEACAYALMNLSRIPKELKQGRSLKVEPDENGIVLVVPKEWKKYIEENRGYIYVLPTETFKERDRTNIKSLVNVKVIDSIEVGVNDFYEMGGIIRTE